MTERGPAVWKADGWEATTRIGLLTPHADVGPEAELQAMSPAAAPVDAIVFGFTSSAYVTAAPPRPFAAQR